MKTLLIRFDFLPVLILAVLVQGGLSTDLTAQCVYEGEGAEFAEQIRAAGDVNGDGYQDILVTAARYAGGTLMGKVYIFKGSGGVFDGIPLYEILGSNGNEFWGYSADGIGDLDGDGKSEFIISSPHYGTTFSPPAFASDTGLAIVYNGNDGSPRWVYLGSFDAYGSYGVGYCVAGVGDINNDYIPDFAIGSRGYSLWAAEGRGRVDIYSGADGDTLQIPGGVYAGESYTLYPDTTLFDTKVGLAIKAAGDLNNDDYDDILVYDDAIPKRIIAFSGFDRDTLFEVIPFPNGQIPSNKNNSYPASSRFAGNGDFNNDDVPDIVVAWRDGGLDSVYVISGTDGSTRLGGPWTEYGGYVDFAGDVNGDNYDDIIIGLGGSLGSGDPGRVVIISGQDQSLLYDVIGNSGDILGRRVSRIGDTDGDGTPEFAAGARGYNGNAGGVFIIADNACAESDITIFGFMNTPLGQAQLNDDTPGELTVGNIGSTGQDGVAIDMGLAEFGVISFDPSSFQIGSQIVVAARDTFQNVSGSLTIDITGGTAYEFTADLSPLGATTYLVNAYDGSTLVDSRPGISGVAAVSNGSSTMITAATMINGLRNQDNPAMTVHFDNTVSITITGGSPVTADLLEIVAEDNIITHTNFLRDIHATGRDLTSFTIVGEELGAFSNRHIAVGQSTLLGEERNDLLGENENGLVVANFSSSGLDGVEIKFYSYDGIDIEGCLFDKPLGLMDVAGSFLDCHAHGLKDGGQTGEPLGSSKLTYSGSTFEITASLSPLGASTFTVEVRDDNGLVGSASGVSGLLAETDEPPVGMKWYNDGINGAGPTYSWVYDPDLIITIPNKGSFTGNRVMIIGEGATSTADVLLSQVVYAADLDTLRIIGEYASPEEQTVNGLSDAGIGSMRWAIDQVNANPGPDIIAFDISGTISLDTPLPAITDDATQILGSSAQGGIHSVIIDGSGLGSGSGITIQSSSNTIEGLVITGFPDNGIEVTGPGSTQNNISGNLIYDNGGLAIDLGSDGTTANDPGDGDTGPNNLLNYPEIDVINSLMDETYEIYGTTVAGARVDLFTAHPAGDDSRPQDPSGYGEAYEYLGSVIADQWGDFFFLTSPDVLAFSILSCTATDPDGNTSEMSANFPLLPRPLIIVAYTYDPAKGGNKLQNGINVIVEDPNGDQFGMDANGDLIDNIPGDQEYIITENEDDSVVIPEPIIGDYIINFIGEAAGSTGSLYAGIIKVDGSLECVLIIDGDIPGTGQMDSYGYTYDEGTYTYINGDANGDWECNVGDAVFIINYVFKSGPAPVPELSGDANCDGEVNVGDAVKIINYVFKGGDPPCQLPVP